MKSLHLRIMVHLPTLLAASFLILFTSSACVPPNEGNAGVQPSPATNGASGSPTISPNETPSPTADAATVLSVEQPGSLTTVPSSLSASPAPSAPSSSPAPSVLPESSGGASSVLLVPVAGVRREDLRDTFTESRSGGRVHDAIDIIAPRGTPVLAVADGRVVKLFQSVPGGITIYQLATDNRTIYYYAHLDRYADNLAEGQTLRRGDTIAYVGDTGNSGAGNYHLHFSVSLVNDPRRWWDGTNINPYPLFFGSSHE